MKQSSGLKGSLKPAQKKTLIFNAMGPKKYFATKNRAS